MEKIQVEKGIAIPLASGHGLTDALKTLDVGDSFLYPKERRSSLGPIMSRLSPKKFITRSVRGTTNVRVWRAA